MVCLQIHPLMIPFHAKILTEFTRHVHFEQNFTNHEIQHKEQRDHIHMPRKNLWFMINRSK